MGRIKQEEPTKLQYKAYLWIVKYVDKNGLSPSLTDIANGLGIMKQSAWKICSELETKGYITKIDGIARSIRPVYED